MTEYKQQRTEKIIYHVGIILLCTWFGTSGYLEITQNPIVWAPTIEMGYPPFFITTLGIAKIIGVLVLLIPNKVKWLKEWVFAALFIDVIFAFISVYSLVGFSGMAKPFIAFVLILITYLMFRKINPTLKLSFN